MKYLPQSVKDWLFEWPWYMKAAMLLAATVTIVGIISPNPQSSPPTTTEQARSALITAGCDAAAVSTMTTGQVVDTLKAMHEAHLTAVNQPSLVTPETRVIRKRGNTQVVLVGVTITIDSRACNVVPNYSVRPVADKKLNPSPPEWLGEYRVYHSYAEPDDYVDSHMVKGPIKCTSFTYPEVATELIPKRRIVDGKEEKVTYFSLNIGSACIERMPEITALRN